MTKLEYLHDEVKYRKQEAWQILSDHPDHKYTDDQIKELCQTFASTPPDILREKYKDDEVTYFGAMALLLFMSLEVKLPPSGEGYQVEDESMADIVLDAMNAMTCLVEAGWKPTEPYAKQALKMRRNQPKTRERKKTSEDYITELIETYVYEKGHPPKYFHIFLSYLERSGCEVDMAEGKKGTIYYRDWDRKWSIGTVKNGYNKLMKQYKNP